MALCWSQSGASAVAAEGLKAMRAMPRMLVCNRSGAMTLMPRIGLISRTAVGRPSDWERLLYASCLARCVSPLETHMTDLYLADQSAFTDFCAGLRGAGWLALDTEFIRERTYYPQLCLIQIAGPDDRIACIDPLALPSLDPLLDLLYDPAMTKILHAAHQDLEIFSPARGCSSADLRHPTGGAGLGPGPADRLRGAGAANPRRRTGQDPHPR